MKQGRTIIFACLAMALVTMSHAQNGRILVTVNDDPVQFGAADPMMMNGRVLVPLRGVLEKMGAFVSWESRAQLVTASKGDINLEMRIGERYALVNQRTVPLDVPAMIYRGSTLVPLRFMSEALGAEVQWDARASHVRILTDPSGQSQEANTGGALNIMSFRTPHQGFVHAGQELEFELRGTSGGAASFQIPGVTQEIAMREVQPGVYTGRWKAPNADNQNPVMVSGASVIGRLRVGTQERLIQAGSNVMIDTQPPRLIAQSPAPNARLTQNQPTLSVVLDEGTGSGIAFDTLRVLLNGKDVTRETEVTNNLVSYRPGRALNPGRHEIEISVRDEAGNPMTAKWAFTVATQTDLIQSFTVSNAENPRAGDVIRLELRGESKATVTYSIGDVVKNLPMTESQPGVYTANYTVRNTDSFDTEIVTARFVTQSREVYTIDASTKIGVAVKPTTPRITTPQANEDVNSPLVIEGTAEPLTDIQIKIDYESTLLGALRMNGTMKELTVRTDEQGRFKTEAIPLESGLIRGSNVRYTITATAVSRSGQKSDPTTVTVR